MTEKTTADDFKVNVERENLVSILAFFSTNITIEEQRTMTGLLKKALREMRLSGCPPLLDRLQLIHEDLLTGAYSLFGFRPLYNYHFDI